MALITTTQAKMNIPTVDLREVTMNCAWEVRLAAAP
jgi:hypothetical protein